MFNFFFYFYCMHQHVYSLKFRNLFQKKLLTISCTIKIFLFYFQFIYGHLVKNFKIQKKPEEEIPRILKQLDYPFTISKTYMYAIGTPHTWPNILVALRWLCELIQVHSDYICVKLNISIPSHL